MSEETTPQSMTVGETVKATVLEQLTKYVREMELGRPISNQEGASNQYLLWVIIRNITRLDGADFAQTYSAFLDFIAEHRQNAFSERAVYRTFEGSRLDPNDERKLGRFMNLALATADRSTRRIGLKQVNLSTTFRDWDGTVLMKMEDFYSI